MSRTALSAGLSAVSKKHLTVLSYCYTIKESNEMKQNKYERPAAFAAVIIFISLLSASCQSELIPEPEMDKIQSSSGGMNTSIEAPAELKASHGKCQEVELSWTGSVSATRYLIYSADTLFDTFKQVGETTGAETTFSIKEEAGTTAFYKVCARNYEGVTSSFSPVRKGSTMATPVITAIESSIDGTSVTIDWYMENCTDDTYQKYTIYEILCTTESGETVAQEAFSAVDSSATRITLAGLQPKTTYYYEVSAYSSQYSDGGKETSSRVSQETLRLSIPNAPINLAASKGTSADAIELEWTLPSFCEISASGGTYTKNPLYFTIERKLESADDSTYRKIVSYLGTITPTAEDKSKILFTCIGESDADGVISQDESSRNLVKVRSVNSDTIEESGIEAYKNYIPSYTISYFDKNVERGQKYTYRVQSYVDGTAKKITADTSAATAGGNLVSKLSFNTKPDYKTEGTKILSIEVAFIVDFETLGQSYNYALVRTFSPAEINGVETGPVPESVYEFTTLAELKAWHDMFDFTQNPVPVQGYYQYALYVCPDGTADSLSGDDNDKITEYKNRAITSIRQEGKTTVLSDSSLMPKLTTFDIADGYKDKFILSWNYEEACEYTVFWKSDGGEEEQSEVISSDSITLNDDRTLATFNHPAQSGETRTYRLRAFSGMESEKNCEDEAGSIRTVKTLGTAAPAMGGVSYDSISVSWNAVQMADSAYEVSAYYADTEEPINGEIITEEKEGVVTCTISKPDGYDDPTLSGKPVTLNVTAKSAVDSSVGSCTVRTLGPALINATTEANARTISLTWNKVEGVSGYLICRTKFDPKGAYIEAADTYYYDVSTNELTVRGQKTAEERAKVNRPAENMTTYTLDDKYCDAEDDSSYQLNQETIFWGSPFGYTVLPVLTEEDFTFTYDGANVKLDSGCAVDYTADGRTLVKVMEATDGYGNNVRAEKSQSATEQKITWEKKQWRPGTPRVFRRRYGSAEPFERVPTEDSLNSNSVLLSYIVPASDIYTPYEYIVKYGNDISISNTEVPPALIRAFKNKPDTRYTYRSDAEREPCYKGYLFTMKDIDEYDLTAEWAGADNPYAERVTWSADVPWDYSSRAVGPGSVAISIRNNNIDSGWHEVVRVSALKPDDKNIRATGTDIAAAVAAGANGILLSPAGIASTGAGTTSGELKVLRDYKHYYSITFLAGNGTPGASFGQKEEQERYAYRQITDEELVRAATLAMAIGAKATGTGWNQGDSTKTYKNGNGETVVTVSTSGGNASNNLVHTLKYSSFTPSMTTKAGKDVTFLTISGNVTGETWTHTLSSGTSGNNRPPYEYHCYNSDKITVSAANDDCKGLYSADIKFNWLNYEPNYRVEDGDTKGIMISYPNGSAGKVFGNITPLPFAKIKGTWSKWDNIDFQQDSAEWQ